MFVWPTVKRKSCIILCMSLVCSAVLNFCDESFSHINCLGKRINVSLVFSVAKWLFTVLKLCIINTINQTDHYSLLIILREDGAQLAYPITVQIGIRK